MLQLRRPLHLVALLVGVLALVLAVAACGGGNNKTDGVASLGGATQTTSAGNAGSSKDERQAALNWAKCMRQHGINMPDPQISGDDIVQQLPDRAEQNSPKFKAAQQACRQYQPNGGQSRPLPAEERQRALAFARCMRQHGINMADPQFTTDGIEQQGPTGVDRDDPRVKAAEQACGQSLPPGKGGGGGR